MAGEVRQQIDLYSLEQYVTNHVPALETPLRLNQFGFGQSNPTYQLTGANDKKYVLRKKPPGKLLSKTAHQVEREYQIIRALGPTDVPVPEVLCLCEDSNVIGTPFYIMEFLHGRHFTNPAMPGVSGEERNALWKSAVETLARLHRVVPQSIGLERFGKPTSFYDRQITTFKKVSMAQSKVVDADTKELVGELPHFDDMVDFFTQHSTQPPDQGTLVHGDYKIDNLMFHLTEPRVIGVLDWEMATIGHPLSDFCNLTSPYIMDGVGTQVELFQPGLVPGLPSREDCMRWYSEIAGYNPAKEVPWGDAFALFRGSVILQGIAARVAGRQTSSAEAVAYGKQARPFAIEAWNRMKQMQQKGRL